MIGIIGALSKELSLIKNNIENIKEEKILGSVFVSGKIFGKDIVISECSIGKVNAAITASVMIDRYSPDVIINTGIAGSMSKEVGILDVVIGSRVSIHDEGEVFERYYPFANSFSVSKNILGFVTETCEKIGREIKIGEIVTGDVFVDNEFLKSNIKNRYINSLAVDMESGAIAKACFRGDKDIIVIRTISDGADNKAKFNYDNFIDEAASLSANIVLELIKNWKV